MDMQGYMITMYENREALAAKPGGVADMLLSYIGQIPTASTYLCYKELNKHYREGGKSIAYKNVHKRVKKLYSLGLIDKYNSNVNNEGSKHGAIYYSLTSSGLFYILRNRLLAYDYYIRGTLPTYGLSIVLEHKNNGLFGFCLFPFIEFQTIEKLTDGYIVDKIFDYLRDCCQTIEELFHSLQHVDQDHGEYRMLGFTDTLIDPECESNPQYGSRQCIEYLKNRFKINWLEEENTKIVEVKKNRVIKFYNNKNELVLRIYPQKNKGILSEGKTKISEFFVEQSEKESYIIRDFIPFATKDSKRDYLNRLFNNENNYFDREMRNHAFRLCGDLLTYICHDYSISDEERLEKQTDSINLGRDPNFLNLIKEFKEEYDSYFNYIRYLNENDFVAM